MVGDGHGTRGVSCIFLVTTKLASEFTASHMPIDDGAGDTHRANNGDYAP